MVASYYTDPLTYVLYDLRTGRFLGRIPLTGVSFGSQLHVTGSPGTFTGSIDIASPAVRALGPLSKTSPARTVIAVDYLGALIWGGIIWPRAYEYDATSRKLTLTATELWSYFGRRVQATDYSSPPYSGLTGTGAKMAIWNATNTDAEGIWDAVLIAWQIVSDALTQVEFGNILGGLGIAANSFTTTAAYLASGTNTPGDAYLSTNYPLSSVQQIQTIVQQLAANGLGVGFDFAVDLAYAAGPGTVPVGTVNLSYPRRGRTYAESRLVLNCASAISYAPPEDGSQAANTIYEQGASGSLVVSQNANPLNDGYPILEQVNSRANILSPSLLALLGEIGIADLYTQSYPVVTPSVVMDLFNSTVPLGEFIVGDDARWIIPAKDAVGGVFDPRFPDGLDGEWRIIGYQAEVADEGQSKITFNLALPPEAVADAPAITDSAIVMNSIAGSRSDYAKLVIGDQPVSYYRLDEAPGSTMAVDQMGGNPGTYQGTQIPNLCGTPLTANNSAGWATNSPGWWLNPGATLSLVTTPTPTYGSDQGEVVTTATDFEGIAFALPGTFEAGKTYTFSVYLRGAAGGELVQVALGAASSDSAAANHTLTTSATRYSVTWTPTQNESAVYAVVRTTSAAAYTFYVNAVQVTETSAAVTYSDTQSVALGQPGALGGSGDSDTAALFDGEGGWVQVPYSASLYTPEFSLECWANMNGLAHQGTFFDSWTGNGYLLRQEVNGSITFYTHYANVGADYTSVNTAANTLVTGAWHHIVGTFDGQIRRIYVDGVLKANDTSAQVYYVNQSGRLGIGGSYAYVNGYMDEAALYAYALSPAQVRDHYLAGVGPFS